MTPTAAGNAAPGTQWWYTTGNVDQIHQQNQAHQQTNQQHPQTNQHQAVCIDLGNQIYKVQISMCLAGFI